jgi:hypothetical protein
MTPILDATAARWRMPAFALMGVGALTIAAGLYWWPERTWSTLLLSNLYLLFVCLAGALILSIQYLAGAGWWIVLRRVPEAMMAGLPIVAILLVVSLFFGRLALYPWSHAVPTFYLNTPFFFARMAFVLLLWVLLAHAIRTASLLQDHDPALVNHQRLVRYSALFIVVFAVSFSVASVDWVMSLAPNWASTIFAVYVFAGLLVSGLVSLTLIVILLRELGPLRGIVTERHLHDLGQLVFGFSTFWAYIWVSQYLLIWYGNLPDEITYFAQRTRSEWLGLFLLNPVINWVVPFLVLMPRSMKHNTRVLAAVCLLLLGGRYLDLYLLIMPDTMGAPTIGPLEVLVPVAYVSLFLFVTWRALAQAPLVPPNDPYLEESLSHHI